MNWTTYDYSPAPCLPCCVVVTTCFLTMPTALLDGSTTNYANLTAATSALTDQAAPNCYAEGRPQGSATRTTFSSSFTSGTLAINSSYTAVSDGAQDKDLARIYLTVAGGLSVVYTISTDAFIGGCSLSLYKDDASTLVDNVSGLSSITGTFSPTIPADGYYYLFASNGGLGATTTSISLSATGGASLLPCGVRAGYDDGSGGTAYVLCV